MTDVSAPHRYKCGKHKPKPNKPKKPREGGDEKTERALRLREQNFVARQPHRLGDDSVLPESALGRFVKAHELGMATFTACMSYFRAWHALCSIKGIPTTVRLDESDHTGAEFDEEAIRDLEARVELCEYELKRAGLSAFVSAKDLITEDVPVIPQRVLPVKRVLLSFAGKLGCGPSPERTAIRSTLKEAQKEARSAGAPIPKFP